MTKDRARARERFDFSPKNTLVYMYTRKKKLKEETRAEKKG